MNIQQKVSLSQYSTMGLGGVAAYLCEVHNRMELLEALSWAQLNTSVPAIMIGSGSNIIWRDEGFSGLIVVDKIERFEIFEEDELNVYLTVGSGENWDNVVDRSVNLGLSGIETLSLIPGTAGATPIQNVGAYGQEISNSLVTIEVFDTVQRDFLTLANSDCNFAYRTSRFKTNDRGRFYITAITLHLTKTNPLPPFYPSLSNYLSEHNIKEYTPAIIRDAVIDIRSSKLPDPVTVHNCGSFYANPIISTAQYSLLNEDLGINIPHWPAGTDYVKLSAAWLIEQVGFKDFHDPVTGMSTWKKQSLVLVNEHALSTNNLLTFSNRITSAVQAQFNIQLQQEPELLP